MRVGSDYVIPLDIRIIAACNKQLSESAIKGSFRHDLFFRINTFELYIPSLCERKEDIILLFEFYLAQYSGENIDKIRIPEEFERLLLQHDWWGMFES